MTVEQLQESGLFEYKLKRSRRRKTVAIKVQQQSVTVYAPVGVAIEELEGWLVSKSGWINEQLYKQSQLLDTRQYLLKDNRVLVFDQPITLVYGTGTRCEWRLDNNQAQPTLQLNLSRRIKHQHAMYQSLIEAFLHEQLESYIEMRVQQYCIKMAEALPSSIRIHTYKRRWGSCNRRRALTFNLLLASAPHTIIDYVIVHELAHLKYLNHSAAFWQRVGEFYPEYKQATTWLKEHGAGLQWVIE
ncbi:M48 family peptidase [Pseudoalteromonas sp. S1727]|uniref:M48 family metallopeptidase n=1 Tax=Pseudoalteromonas sp. S1727 TaxID=2066514 RepID=UPI001109AFEF|nr:SprT family zinc-dependent metalloprotease [Pseudoalteromonas sp. S1727]TMN71910.1 M48 family peptidase [Pseudoalteromonas sp. S1727]